MPGTPRPCCHAPVLDWLRDMARSAESSRALSRGIQAYRVGELEAARAALDRVLAASEPDGSPSQRMHRRSVRLMAVTLRAEVAAKQGDDAAARASIEEGLALWQEARTHPKIGARSVEAFASWERWARGWLAWRRRA